VPGAGQRDRRSEYRAHAPSEGSRTCAPSITIYASVSLNLRMHKHVTATVSAYLPRGFSGVVGTTRVELTVVILAYHDSNGFIN
jgi:hypothetical protein